MTDHTVCKLCESDARIKGIVDGHHEGYELGYRKGKVDGLAIGVVMVVAEFLIAWWYGAF